MIIRNSKDKSLNIVKSLLAGVAISAVGASCASANEFPDGPVKIIVPFSAGGTTDTAARMLAPALSRNWGEPVIVENKPGAGNIVGLIEAKNAEPDGHTIVIAPDPALAVNPLVYEDLPYDVEEDFEPITMLVRFTLGVVATDDTGVSSLEELIELSKEKSLSYGSFGPGTAPHLLIEALGHEAGFEMQHVPYGGLSPINLALQTAEIDVSVMGLGAANALVKSGDVELLAVDGEERSQFFPDVPTFSEEGYGNVRAPAWWAVLAPRGVPKDVVEKLNDDIANAMTAPDFQNFLENGFYEAGMDSPEDTADEIQETMDYWRPVIERMGLTL